MLKENTNIKSVNLTSTYENNNLILKDSKGKLFNMRLSTKLDRISFYYDLSFFFKKVYGFRLSVIQSAMLTELIKIYLNDPDKIENYEENKIAFIEELRNNANTSIQSSKIEKELDDIIAQVRTSNTFYICYISKGTNKIATFKDICNLCINISKFYNLE